MSSSASDVPVDPDRPQGAVVPDPDDLPSDAGYGGEIIAGTDKDVGAGVRRDTPAGTPDADPAQPGSVQTEPAMDMNDPSTQAKIDGIVAQTRADFRRGSGPAQVGHALRQRFSDIGVDVDVARIRQLAAE